jgi:hypothetical protein
MAGPGQDPRGAPDLDPLWLMLDLTPEGRGTHWYPNLNYRQQLVRRLRSVESNRRENWERYIAEIVKTKEIYVNRFCDR